MHTTEITSVDRRAPGRRVILTLCGLLATMTGCSDVPPVVFVPGSTFRESLFVASESGLRASVAVGEPLILHAERISGPWRQISRDSLPAGACWLRSAPPEYEPNVAANVRWEVAPDGSATFNVSPRDDGTRDVRFSEPGQYRVMATSASACGDPYSGDTILVVVTPR